MEGLGYKSQTGNVKREKKKKQFLQEISMHLHNISYDDARVATVFITHVDLSADTGICYVYCSAYPNVENPLKSSKEIFKEALVFLKLYKPSIRSALAKTLSARYVPQIMFIFDENRAKVDKLNGLLDQVHGEVTQEDKVA